MLDNLMLFLIISVFALFYWIYYTGSRKSPFTTQWDQLPTREQYLATHPDAIDGDILFCIHCGHHQQLDVGLVHQADFRRQYLCAQCRQPLYREEQ
ncbi:TPA: hypothetical protein RQN12_004465 [Aeromonas dhakensis]|nr:hypothetical protein [Aeromonas dhakensis]